jgi:hypothetical protein
MSIRCSLSERARAVLLVLRSSLSRAAQLDQSRACLGLTDPLTGSLAAPIIVAQLEGAGRAHHTYGYGRSLSTEVLMSYTSYLTLLRCAYR